jgi:hypothetical protein
MCTTLTLINSYALLAQFIYVLRMILTITDWSIVIETRYVLCEVRTEFLNIIQIIRLSARNLKKKSPLPSVLPLFEPTFSRRTTSHCPGTLKS